MATILSTGIYIPVEKQSMFLLVFEDVLLRSYNIVPIFGQATKKSICEIKFMCVTTNSPPSLAWDSKKAKKFIKRNLNSLHGERKSKENAETSTKIIDLDDYHSTPNQPLARTVDLTKPEPEVIVLDDTINNLDTTNNQPESTPTHHIFNVETSVKKAEDDIQILAIKHNKKDRSLNSMLTCEPDSEVKIICSTSKPKKKSKSIVSKCNNLIPLPDQNNVEHSEVKIIGSTQPIVRMESKSLASRLGDLSIFLDNNKDGQRIVKNNKRRTPSEKDNAVSVLSINKTRTPSRKRRKLNNVENTPLETITNIHSPPPKQLSDNILKYYANMDKALNNIKNRRKSPRLVDKVKHLQNGSRVRGRSKSPLKKLNRKQQKKVNITLRKSPGFHCRNRGETSLTRSQSSKRPEKLNLATETNIFNPNPYEVDREGLRPIVIDGSNIAVSHGMGTFSVKGLQICVDYFAKKGHKQVKVFLPLHRQSCFSEEVLTELRSKCDMVFTPSRSVNGVMKTSYDDRFIVQYAVEFGGVVVSTDNYRDLLKENPRWRDTIQKRLLMFTWVDDFLMFPMDPLGRRGPTLEEFLRF